MTLSDRVCAPTLCGLLLFATAFALSAQNTPLTTLAGTGIQSSGGCFLPAVAAPPFFFTFFVPGLGGPNGVAVDPSGRPFVSDTDNNCVYRLDADGLLRVQVGFSNPPFRIGNGSHGFLDGDAAAAELWAPQHLAVDMAGNLFIADETNSLIRKVDTTKWTITTVAGGGSSRPFDGAKATDSVLLFPQGVTVDPSGNLYFSDNTKVVYKVDTSGIITRFAGGGGSTYGGEGIPALGAAMTPFGLAADASGNVFIADWGNSIIRKVDTHGVLTTVAGNPFNVTFLGDGNTAAFGATLIQPRGVAVDTLGNIFIADTGHHRIRMVDTNGIINTIAGDGTPGFNTGELNFPSDVAVDNLGNVFIADAGNGALRALITTPRKYQLTINSTGTGSGLLTGPGLYPVGEFASVSAAANTNSTFDGWTGPNADECARGSVLMNLDKSCTAKFTQLIACAKDISGSLRVTRSGFTLNFGTQRFQQTIKLTNTGTSSITGPISVALDSLPAGVSLFNKAGITICSPGGSPFINAGFTSLAAGASFSVVLQFTDPSNAAITYTTRVLGATGTR